MQRSDSNTELQAFGGNRVELQQQQGDLRLSLSNLEVALP